MIHSLEFSVTFAHNGRTISGRHSFERGMTLISGANGAGKSTRLEMIRFALFGSSALRGDIADYAKLDVTLVFSVLDRKLTIERSLKYANIAEHGSVIATGHKGVNNKVVEILGYGSAVFDIANAAKQKEIAALSALPPVERRRMVDRVIGLDIVEALAQWAGREARVLEKAADMAEASLPPVPVEPSRPEGWMPLADLDAQRSTLRGMVAKKRELEAFLKTEPPQPQAPARTIDNPNWLTILEEHERQRLRAIGDLASLRSQLARIPEASLTADEVASMRAYYEAKRVYDHAKMLSTGLTEAPRYTTAELDEMDQQWEQLYLYNRWTTLHSAGHHVCPACSHTWPIQAEAMADLPDFHGKPEPFIPSLAQPTIAACRQQIRRYEAETKDREEINAVLLMGLPVRPIENPQLDINKAEAALRLAPERDRILAEIARVQRLAAAEDLSKELADLRKLQQAWEAFAAAWTAYEAWQDRAKAARGDLVPLEGMDEALAVLEALRDAVVAYDVQAAAYDRAVEQRVSAEIAVAEKRKEAAAWGAARRALETIRTKTKGHLLPSLGVVAGGIMSRITNGAFQNVTVDDDFEVKIEGQRLATLSGSESTAANLALRIALGQILTNRVFGVFLGDEIDADMDEERAASTAASLRSLTSSGAVPQLVVVSHKRIAADHYIDT